MEQKSDYYENIQVLIRVKPNSDTNPPEKNQKTIKIIDENTIQSENHNFQFDKIYKENSNQLDIYNTTGVSIVEEVLKGYNVCVFAYGQTGSGKTHTMMGDINSYIDKGLQPRIITEIFQKLSEQSDSSALIKCSFLEIYNENIIDLINIQEDSTSKLQIKNDIKQGIIVDGLIETQTNSYEEAFQLMQQGIQNRSVASTVMNNYSSRSHSIFSMQIEKSVIINQETKIIKSKLHFIDLAGSERQKKTQSSGDRLKEAGCINKSLSQLGIVINCLVESDKNKHIPYRDSKLTYFLKDCLGGNSKTFMIATTSFTEANKIESISTLKFAQRVKQIKNQAMINESSLNDNDSLQQELKRLREEILILQENNQNTTPKRINQSNDLQIWEQENLDQIVDLQDKLFSKENEIQLQKDQQESAQMQFNKDKQDMKNFYGLTVKTLKEKFEELQEQFYQKGVQINELVKKQVEIEKNYKEKLTKLQDENKQQQIENFELKKIQVQDQCNIYQLEQRLKDQFKSQQNEILKIYDNFSYTRKDLEQKIQKLSQNEQRKTKNVKIEDQSQYLLEDFGYTQQSTIISGVHANSKQKLKFQNKESLKASNLLKNLQNNSLDPEKENEKKQQFQKYQSLLSL